MNTQDYTRKINVSAAPDEVYQALTVGFDKWWTKPDRPITKEGEFARFTFPPGKSYWTFEAVRLVPGEYVELKCIEALHLHEGQPKEIETEWLGTRVIWRIEAKGEKTEIHFQHVGLEPQLNCFEICEAGWDFFFVDSLQAYLETGVGKPHIYSP